MPTRPPTFRPAAARERKPWSLAPGAADHRKRGRAGQRERHQVLAEEPFCRECLKAGKRVSSDVVDHIMFISDWPIGKPGWDDRANKQGLCDPCHDAKSAAERAAAREARSEHD